MSTDHLPPEDQPPSAWRRPATDDEAQAMLPPESLSDPVSVGMLFCNALPEQEKYHVALLNLTTPESHPAWGDFSKAAQFLASIEDVGYGTQAEAALGDENVRYFKILRGVTESYEVLDAQPVLIPAVLTMVWREDREQWLVHALGEPVRPEDVPH